MSLSLAAEAVPDALIALRGAEKHRAVLEALQRHDGPAWIGWVYATTGAAAANAARSGGGGADHHRRGNGLARSAGGYRIHSRPPARADRGPGTGMGESIADRPTTSRLSCCTA